MAIEMGHEQRWMQALGTLVTMVLFAAAALIGVYGLSATSTPSWAHAAARASVPEGARSMMAPPELPPEWVWERKAITFDHMFLERPNSDRRWNRTGMSGEPY